MKIIFRKKWVFLVLASFVFIGEIVAKEQNIFSKQFDLFQGKKTRQELEDRLSRFLQKDQGIARYYTILEDRFILYKEAGEGDSANREIEYELALAIDRPLSSSSIQSIEEKRKKDHPSLFLGKKIAIDPGHFGGKYARLEARYIDIPSTLNQEKLQFDEGTLSYLTALYLKTLLEKEGAIVFLTRDGIEKGAYNQDFFEWLKGKPELWNKEIRLSRIFQTQYNLIDLRARAEKINAFSPDLTIVIHYNSHHAEGEDNSNSAMTEHNYNMMFIPGAFCRTELSNPEYRFEFLRLLLSEDLEKSLSLSRFVLESCNAILDVPVVKKSDGARYLNSVCLKLEEGVYARNLAMTRQIHSPVCYGETLVQNHVEECRALSKKDFVIGAVPCSSRLKQVAEGYFYGIKRYLEEMENRNE